MCINRGPVPATWSRHIDGIYNIQDLQSAAGRSIISIANSPTSWKNHHPSQHQLGGYLKAKKQRKGWPCMSNKIFGHKMVYKVREGVVNRCIVLAIFHKMVRWTELKMASTNQIVNLIVKSWLHMPLPRSNVQHIVQESSTNPWKSSYLFTISFVCSVPFLSSQSVVITWYRRRNVHLFTNSFFILGRTK